MQVANVTLGKKLTSSIGKKLFVALSGIFLVLFLTVHLIGNLQLLVNDGGKSFNVYAEFMGHNLLIQIVSKVNFALILGHAFFGLYLMYKNRAARPQGYVANNANANSLWFSRSMGLLGTIIFAFIAVHLVNFYWVFKFGEIPMVEYFDADTREYTRLENYYLVVAEGFKSLPLVLFYVVAQLAIAFHLAHGFQSFFQTMGLNNRSLQKVWTALGYGYTVVVCGLYCIIPILMYLNK